MSQEVQSQYDEAAKAFTLGEMSQHIAEFAMADLEGLFTHFEAGESDEV